MSPWVREALRCPTCHGELHDAGPHVGGAPAALVCAVCRVSYPVTDGIVHVLGDEATSL
ncbi:MAG: hypothetical protein LBK59_05790 [Bifidobacteriaceae bacterium]|nr:hypothetical protein [Bifidobacteriaceae bacterium]